MSTAGVDPIRERRARIARLVELGQRVGYGLFGIAVVGFVIGFIVGFDEHLRHVIVVTACCSDPRCSRRRSCSGTP